MDASANIFDIAEEEDATEVARWLDGLGLGRYFGLLRAEGFDDFRIIRDATEEDVTELATLCGMPRLHAKQLRRGIQSLQGRQGASHNLSHDRVDETQDTMRQRAETVSGESMSGESIRPEVTKGSDVVSDETDCKVMVCERTLSEEPLVVTSDKFFHDSDANADRLSRHGQGDETDCKVRVCERTLSEESSVVTSDKFFHDSDANADSLSRHGQGDETDCKVRVCERTLSEESSVVTSDKFFHDSDTNADLTDVVSPVIALGAALDADIDTQTGDSPCSASSRSHDAQGAGPSFIWDVVGENGVLVRVGQDLKSAVAEPSRLSHGAVVKELSLVGTRLQFQLIFGEGPLTGWVTIALGEKPLLVKRESAQKVLSPRRRKHPNLWDFRVFYFFAKAHGDLPCGRFWEKLSKQEVDAPTHHEGDLVELVGLGNQQYNGVTGRLLRPVFSDADEAGRWIVRCHDGRDLSVRTQNLVPWRTSQMLSVESEFDDSISRVCDSAAARGKSDDQDSPPCDRADFALEEFERQSCQKLLGPDVAESVTPRNQVETESDSCSSRGTSPPPLLAFHNVKPWAANKTPSIPKSLQFKPRNIVMPQPGHLRLPKQSDGEAQPHVADRSTIMSDRPSFVRDFKPIYPTGLAGAAASFHHVGQVSSSGIGKGAQARNNGGVAKWSAADKFCGVNKGGTSPVINSIRATKLGKGGKGKMGFNLV